MSILPKEFILLRLQAIFCPYAIAVVFTNVIQLRVYHRGFRVSLSNCLLLARWIYGVVGGRGLSSTRIISIEGRVRRAFSLPPLYLVAQRQRPRHTSTAQWLDGGRRDMPEAELLALITASSVLEYLSIFKILQD